jgi:homogentisate 1,2-dioxygenase
MHLQSASNPCTGSGLRPHFETEYAHNGNKPAQANTMQMVLIAAIAARLRSSPATARRACPPKSWRRRIVSNRAKSYFGEGGPAIQAIKPDQTKSNQIRLDPTKSNYLPFLEASQTPTGRPGATIVNICDTIFSIPQPIWRLRDRSSQNQP